MHRGVALIKKHDDWDKAARHLWGLALKDFPAYKKANPIRKRKPKSIRYQRIGATLLLKEITGRTLILR